MQDQLDLSVPNTKHTAAEKGSSRRGLLSIVTILVLAQCFMSVILLQRDSAVNKVAPVSVDTARGLAMKLEKQGLDTAALEVWRDYVRREDITREERSRIWYRIGMLHQKARNYESALHAFYTSESNGEIKRLSDEINRRVQECLAGMGRFAALRYELADRVSADTSSSGKGDRVVAEIGSVKITRAALDQSIERSIDQQLSSMTGLVPPEQQLAQKAQLVKQYSTDSQRLLFLNQMVLEEIIYRKACDENYLKDAEVRSLLQEQERKLVAGKLMQKETFSKISITKSDMQNQYTAFKDRYVQKDKDGKEAQLTFEQAQNQIYQELMQDKIQQIQRQLLDKLRDKYSVVIHSSEFKVEQKQ